MTMRRPHSHQFGGRSLKSLTAARLPVRAGFLNVPVVVETVQSVQLTLVMIIERKDSGVTDKHVYDGVQLAVSHVNM